MKVDRHTHPLEPSIMLKKELHPYIHGGGFGVATEILADPSFAEGLQDLEPHRFDQCDRILEQHNRAFNCFK